MLQLNALRHIVRQRLARGGASAARCLPLPPSPAAVPQALVVLQQVSPQPMTCEEVAELSAAHPACSKPSRAPGWRQTRAGDVCWRAVLSAARASLRGSRVGMT